MNHLLDEEIYKKCLEEVKKLPQFEFLLPQNVDSWLDETYKNDPERIFWHIKRLYGFGGSEVGHLVANDYNEYDPFGSPREVVASKLMLSLPSAPTGDTERGTEMEELISKKFRAMFNATPLDEAMKAMSSYRSAKHPWLVGNTDDFVRIGRKNYLTDYKFPREVKFDKDGNCKVKFDYIAQLHHYALILKDMGEQVDGLLLAQFDTVTWKPIVATVPIDQRMFDSILRNGDNMWFDYVMSGNLPAWNTYEDKAQLMDTRLKEEDRLRLTVLCSELSKLLPLANKAYSMAASIKEEMNEILGNTYVGTPKIASGLVEISVKESMDPEKIKEEASKLNINVEKYEKPTTPNYQKAWDELAKIVEAKGENMNQFMDKAIDYDAVANDVLALDLPKFKLVKEDFKIEITKSKKAHLLAPLEELKVISADSINEHLKVVGERDVEPLIVPEPAPDKKGKMKP